MSPPLRPTHLRPLVLPLALAAAIGWHAVAGAADSTPPTARPPDPEASAARSDPAAEGSEPPEQVSRTVSLLRRTVLDLLAATGGSVSGTHPGADRLAGAGAASGAAEKPGTGGLVGPSAAAAALAPGAASILAQPPPPPPRAEPRGVDNIPELPMTGFVALASLAALLALAVLGTVALGWSRARARPLA